MSKVKEKKNKDDSVGLGGLLIWQSRGVSCAIATLVMTYLTIYATDTLKVPAATVGLILVISKVVDGITDMVAGVIVDRTETKWGRARPYEIFIIGLWLCTWLMFSCPESLSTAVKCVWIFIMYTLANAICYTFLNANGNVYMVRAYKEKQYVKLTSYGSFFTMISAMIFNIVFPSAMGKIATSAAGWSRLILMVAVPMAAIGILRMLFVKEKYDVDVSAQQNGEKVGLKDVLNIFKTNKYIIIVALVTFVTGFVGNMGVTSYYYTYIVGNIGLMGIASIATIIAIPIAFTFPKLIAKFSVTKLMTVGFLIAALGNLMNFFAGSNMIMLMIASILTGVGTVPSSMLMGLVIIECAEFNEWKQIPRMEGTLSSINGFSSKVGAAIGSGAMLGLLSLAGYTGTATTMPDSAITMIRLLFSIIPMVLYIVTAIALKFYKLDKLMPQIKADNQARREAIKNAQQDNEQ